MTTLYWAGTTWAFSVRPDLWAAGQRADLEWSWARLAWWTDDPGAMRWVRGYVGLVVQYAAPGAAEAMILAGQVTCGHLVADPGLTWTEVAP